MVHSEIAGNLRQRPWGVMFPVIAFAGLIATVRLRSQGRERQAFLASCAALYSLLATAAVSVFPNLLPGRNPAHSLSVFEDAAAVASLRTGLGWWIPGILLVIGYFAFVYARAPKTFSLEEIGPPGDTPP